MGFSSNSPARTRAESGFTLVEVMVAIALLLTAVLGLMAMTDSAARTTTDTKAREGAVNLEREILEAAGGIAYSQLTPSTLVPTLQALPALTSESGSGTWTLTRRASTGATGFTYTVNATMCSTDDVSDGYGDRAGITWCEAGVPSGTADPQPEDFKRVAVTVSWTTKGQTHSVRQTALFAKNGAPDLPIINSLQLTTPVVGTPANPTISSSATTATFTATATSTAQAVQYSVDGVNTGNATKSGSNWTFTVNIAGWTDGAYTIGARAVNAAGVPGPTRTLTLTLARSQPAAPSGLVGGRNSVTRSGSLVQVAELDWLPNSERNVLGYRVYRPGGSLACPGNTSTFDLTSSCIDFSPVDGTYSVVALYRDSGGTLREGPASTVNVQPLSVALGSFYFKNTTSYTGTNCTAADGKRDAEENYAGAGTDSTFPFSGAGVVDLSFCTRSLNAGEATTAGTTRVDAWFTNNAGACSMTAGLRLNGIATPYSSTVTIPKGGNATQYSWQWSTPAYTFANGDRISAYFSSPSGGECDKTTLVFGSTTHRSRIQVPGSSGGQPVGKPSPPTNLQGTANGDGSKALNWTAPSGGNPVAFYRIYQDGVEYTQRYDTTGDASTTYADPNPDGLQHSYYITAVSANLAESSYVGPVTP